MSFDAFVGALLDSKQGIARLPGNRAAATARLILQSSQVRDQVSLIAMFGGVER